MNEKELAKLKTKLTRDIKYWEKTIQVMKQDDPKGYEMAKRGYNTGFIGVAFQKLRRAEKHRKSLDDSMYQETIKKKPAKKTVKPFNKDLSFWT